MYKLCQIILVFCGIPSQFYARYQTVINQKICFDVEAFLKLSERTEIVRVFH